MFDKSEKAKKTEEEVKFDELENKDKAEEEARDEELRREEEEEDSGGLAGFKEGEEEAEQEEQEEEEVEEGEEATEPVSEEKLIQRTPNEVSTDSPEESAARYGIDPEVTKEDDENPRVEYYKTEAKQVPAGTHLHPDIVKDMMNKGISQHTTDSAQVMRNVTVGYDFADDAEHNDKC